MTSTKPSPRGGSSSSFGLQSVGPVLLFLAINRVGGLRWAVIGATALSVYLVVNRRRNGLPLGRFMPIVTAAVLIRGAIGAITGSETIYFGLGIATKYLVALVLLASVLVSRPLAAFGAPFVLDLPTEAQKHKAFRTAMALITALGALYYLMSATLDVWLFRRNDVEGFVLLRFLTNWPLSTAFLVAIFAVAQTQLRKIPGISSVPELIERKMALGLGPDVASED